VKDPALVRTVRLVAAAVARRAGVDEQLVEEVRLAVGEACALLIGERGPGDSSAAPVSVSMTIDGTLSVVVATSGPDASAVIRDSDAIEPWALLRGLVDDFEIDRSGSVTTVSMSWVAA
jgi:anti-sigma regulatory factor (Ser/Thr protein kinase)